MAGCCEGDVVPNINAKVQHSGVCNAVDALLVHTAVASELLLQLAAMLQPQWARFFADVLAYPLLSGSEPATAKTFDTENLTLLLGVRVVADLDQVLAHIAAHSTGDNEAVLAQDATVFEPFLLKVDAASVIANASTRFANGGVLVLALRWVSLHRGRML